MSIIFYSTGRSWSDIIIKNFFHGTKNLYPDKDIRHINIQNFIDNEFTLPADAETIICLGILRGTGVAVKKAKEKNINHIFLDNSYFDPGYSKNPFWTRITVNGHCMNYLPDVVEGVKYEKLFSKKYPILPWKPKSERGKNILVLPPTHGVTWFLNEENWLSDTINKIKNQLPEKDHYLIKVREKPANIIVDSIGNIIGEKRTDHKTSFIDDIKQSNVVVAYNSACTLDAVRLGYPVITSENNPGYPVSFKIEDINENNNEIFEKEPTGRLNLFKWLAENQFNKLECLQGIAWNTLEKRKGWIT